MNETNCLYLHIFHALPYLQVLKYCLCENVLTSDNEDSVHEESKLRGVLGRRQDIFQ